MKFLKGQIFGLLVLLGVALPLQGMTNRTYQRLSKLKYGQPLPKQPINVPVLINTPEQTDERTSPFDGGQKMRYTTRQEPNISYSSSTSGQQGSQGSSFWNWVRSFFESKPSQAPVEDKQLPYEEQEALKRQEEAQQAVGFQLNKAQVDLYWYHKKQQELDQALEQEQYHKQQDLERQQRKQQQEEHQARVEQERKQYHFEKYQQRLDKELQEQRSRE